MKIGRENPNLVKIGQKCGTLFMNTKHVLLLSVTLNCHKALPSMEMVSSYQHVHRSVSPSVRKFQRSSH